MGSNHPVVYINDQKISVVAALKTFLKVEVDSDHVVSTKKDCYK